VLSFLCFSFLLRRGLVDLSWNKYNLFNLNAYSRAGPERESSKTTFQLRWRAKQLASAYHAPHLTQHAFRKLRARNLPSLARLDPEKSLSLPTPPTT
jgi:ribosomal protein S4